MLARGNENFRALGEHGFSFFQVKMFTGSVSALLTSTSLKINNYKLQKKLKIMSKNNVYVQFEILQYLIGTKVQSHTSS